MLTLQKAVQQLEGLVGPVRAANIRQFQDEAAVARFCDGTLARARLVILRLLGGKNHFPLGFEKIVSFCKARQIALVAVPGDQDIDPELTAVCTVPLIVVNQIFAYLTLGGVENFSHMLRYASDAILKTAHGFEAPQDVPLHGLYWPEGIMEDPSLPTVGILFYRAHWMCGDTAVIDAMARALREKGLNARAVYCYSLKHTPSPYPLPQGGEGDTIPCQSEGTVSPCHSEGEARRISQKDRVDQAGDGLQEIFEKYFVQAPGRAGVKAVVSTLSYTVAQLQTQGAVQASGDAMVFLSQCNVPIFQAVPCGMSRRQWLESPAGLSPRDTSMKVVLPEFDGRVMTHVISFTEPADHIAELGAAVSRLVPDNDRIDAMACLVKKWVALGLVPPEKKRLAILLTNFPNKNARIGNAVGLDTPASAIVLLKALAAQGYEVGEIPPDGDSLMRAIIDRCSLDKEELTERQLDEAVGHVASGQYQQWFLAAGKGPQKEMAEQWGDPPGNVFFHRGQLAIPGIVLGNVFVGVQPARGYGDNPRAIYHSPDLVPTHHYLAFYRWLAEDFGAQAVVHLGKHGTLEWLPGKGLGLSEDCYPDLILKDLPNFYPFIVNDPGEGTQAKRRAHAVIIDHLIPPMTRAETYDQLAKLEQLMDEYYRMAAMDPAKLPLIRQQIWTLAVESSINKDLAHEIQPQDFDHFLLEVDGYLCEIKDSQIRDGLHVLGQMPAGEQLLDLLIAITRLPNAGTPGLRGALLQHFGFDPQDFVRDLGLPLRKECPRLLAGLNPRASVITRGDLVDCVHDLSKVIFRRFAQAQFDTNAIDSLLRETMHGASQEIAQVLRFLATELIPNLQKTPQEIAALLDGLSGRFVPPGPSGAPTRGCANVLPTGRNFYSVDIHRIPSPAAWEVGQTLARELLARYVKEEGSYPETVGTVIWGTSNMRTHGDDIAQMLFLLGVQPLWNLENGRVEGMQLIPLQELGRPRIDVLARISGFFRDAFPNLVVLLDKAVQMAASAPEEPDQNYLRKHWLAEQATKGLGQKSLYRLFSSRPGCYGTGILQAMHAQNWKTDQDLADIYCTWGGYAYTQTEYGVQAHEQFQQRLSQIRVVAQNQDNREHDIFDSDDYFQFHGGMIASIRSLVGTNPKAFLGDSSRPDAVKMRSLKEEAQLVFRSRVVNPKWIAAMQRHGYKGAFEMAATIDYLFGYDATAHVLEDWMYEKVSQAYLFDEQNRAFLEKSNPWAMADMSKRLLEAAQRELWENPDPQTLERLKQIFLETEASLEGRKEGD